MVLNIGLFRTDYSMTSPLEEFQYFLERDLESFAEELTEYDFGPGMPLFDILELWLIGGNGFQQCPTYQSFLIASLEIIDWASRKRVPEAPISGPPPIWQGRATSLFDNGRYERSSIFRSHPLLMEEHFESLRHRREAAERNELRVRLDMILERLSEPHRI